MDSFNCANFIKWQLGNKYTGVSSKMIVSFQEWFMRFRCIIIKMQGRLSQEEAVYRFTKIFIGQYMASLHGYGQFQDEALNLLTHFLIRLIKGLSIKVKRLLEMQGRTLANPLHLLVVAEQMGSVDFQQFLQHIRSRQKVYFKEMDTLKDLGSKLLGNDLKTVNRYQPCTQYSNINYIPTVYRYNINKRALPYRHPICQAVPKPMDLTYKDTKMVLNRKPVNIETLDAYNKRQMKLALTGYEIRQQNNKKFPLEVKESKNRKFYQQVIQTRKKLENKKRRAHKQLADQEEHKAQTNELEQAKCYYDERENSKHKNQDKPKESQEQQKGQKEGNDEKNPSQEGQVVVSQSKEEALQSHQQLKKANNCQQNQEQREEQKNKDQKEQNVQKHIKQVLQVLPEQQGEPQAAQVAITNQLQLLRLCQQEEQRLQKQQNDLKKAAKKNEQVASIVKIEERQSIKAAKQLNDHDKKSKQKTHICEQGVQTSEDKSQLQKTSQQAEKQQAQISFMNERNQYHRSLPRYGKQIKQYGSVFYSQQSEEPTKFIKKLKFDMLFKL